MYTLLLVCVIDLLSLVKTGTNISGNSGLLQYKKTRALIPNLFTSSGQRCYVFKNAFVDTNKNYSFCKRYYYRSENKCWYWLVVYPIHKER